MITIEASRPDVGNAAGIRFESGITIFFDWTVSQGFTQIREHSYGE